ncbi:MAG: hypothetical protein JXA99_15795 [Candidatus Lokiarchaeota archaeon]|nr:hypothetical protein [Candidatus Lokiarchaeota archaeon]
MEILFILEIINGILMATLSILATILFQIRSRSLKIPSILYYSIVAGLFGIMNLFNIFSLLFENNIFARISGILWFPLAFFVAIFVNYTMKETIFSSYFVIICSLGILLIYLGIQPEAVQITSIYGYLRTSWMGLFLIIILLYHIFIACYVFFWGFKTWMSAPLPIKKKGFQIFMGTNIATIGAILIIFIHYIEPYFYTFLNIPLVIGFSIGVLRLYQEPKLLFVLRYKVFRIIVRDHDGNPLFDFDWSDSDINEIMFTGFLNAVEVMSEEIMRRGGLIDINLFNGILTLNRTEYITVGLIASKTSKILRECLVNFSNDFEKEFKRLLKKSCIDMNEYKEAYNLIKKYFAHIPSEFIRDESEYILSSEYGKVPQQIENKFKNIFTNEKEYNLIIDELGKTPICVSSEFLDLYNELKDKVDKIDSKYRSQKDKNKLS